MRKLTLNRRQLLRGMIGGVGAAVALPTLEAMLNGNGTALADGTPVPTRLGVFFFGNGVRLDRFVPGETGAGWQLSEELQPLVNVKDYLNVVTGYTAKAGYGRRGHHDGSAAILSGIPFIALPSGSSSYSSKFGGPSIDQVAADIIGTTTTFKSVHVGVSKQIIRSEGPTLECISHRGPDQPIESERNPRALFDQLFGHFTPPAVEDPTNALRISVLDVIKDDARALRARLGSADRIRLEAHLSNIEALERQISAAPPELTSSCLLPAAPEETNRDMNGHEPLESVSHIMSDLIALAFACDLTRVATYMLTGSVALTVYYMEGIDRGQHELSHEQDQQQNIHRTVVWNFEQLAYLLEKMKNTPEGDGNLLDHSVWIASTDVAEGITHSSNDYPIVVAGRANGFLKHPGVHVRGSRDNNTSDVLLTVLRAAGTGLSEVGRDQGYSNSPCGDIEV